MQERELSFEKVVSFIKNGHLLDVIKHPNKDKYPNQKIFIVEINDYAYMIPYVESEEEVFLKTIIPSRKATKKYLGGSS
ncbi:MAG: toxin [Gammaproteobacteria bacterium]|nr:MAG: toxin [Gammaproteobacteria bacterium]RKZ42432.1 MAG: toxin [Gammaproteobacteria bacterium]RKZ76804.1 MAG: toxin [Gammaproteobacteria bacterium]